jgi:hypothetical protein
MTVKRSKERFKKNMKEDVDIYFPLEFGFGGYFKSLVSTVWPTSQLTLSK